MTFQEQPTTGPAIRLTRVFNAPRHLVIEALTHPEHRRHWWGPEAAADARATVTTLVSVADGRTRVTVTIRGERR